MSWWVYAAHVDIDDTDDATETLLSRLEQKAEHHTREAERYRVAAEVVRSEVRMSGRTPTRNTHTTRRTTAVPGRGTISMIQEVLSEAGVALDLNTLTDRMLAGGWETTSQVPQNTVRTAAMRLTDRSVVVRDSEGRYGLKPSFASADVADANDGPPPVTDRISGHPPTFRLDERP